MGTVSIDLREEPPKPVNEAHVQILVIHTIHDDYIIAKKTDFISL